MKGTRIVIDFTGDEEAMVGVRVEGADPDFKKFVKAELDTPPRPTIVFPEGQKSPEGAAMLLATLANIPTFVAEVSVKRAAAPTNPKYKPPKAETKPKEKPKAETKEKAEEAEAPGIPEPSEVCPVEGCTYKAYTAPAIESHIKHAHPDWKRPVPAEEGGLPLLDGRADQIAEDEGGDKPEALAEAASQESDKEPVSGAHPSLGEFKPRGPFYVTVDGGERKKAANVQEALDLLGVDKENRPKHNRWERLNKEFRDKIEPAETPAQQTMV